MSKPLADYVKLPQLEEYKEWFKDFADLYREDGILQVTWKTLDGPMQHSGMSHRAIGQLVRVLSLDFKNEIIIFTHIGDSWMTESDPNGWETYSELLRRHMDGGSPRPRRSGSRRRHGPHGTALLRHQAW